MRYSILALVALSALTVSAGLTKPVEGEASVPAKTSNCEDVKPTETASANTPSKETNDDNEGEGADEGPGNVEEEEEDNNGGGSSPPSIITVPGPSTGTVFSSVVKTITSCSVGVPCHQTSAKSPTPSAPSVTLVPSAPTLPVTSSAIVSPLPSISASSNSPTKSELPSVISSSAVVPIPESSAIPTRVIPTLIVSGAPAPAYSNGTVPSGTKPAVKPSTVLLTSVVGTGGALPSKPTASPSTPAISASGGEKVVAGWGLAGVAIGLMVLF